MPTSKLSERVSYKSISLDRNLRRDKVNVEIEPATTRTIKELLRIERECFTAEAYTREYILRLLKNPNAITFMARIGNDVAGFVIGLVEGRGTVKIGHIVTIDVAVKYRQKGIGLTLLKEVERAFLQRNIRVVYLEVRADNQAARKLYLKQGYEETKLLEDYYSCGVNALRLIKNLKHEPGAS